MRIKSKVVNIVDQDHLYAHRISHFRTLAPRKKTPKPIPPKQLDTNFDIILNCPYVFVLIHLKSNKNTKNKLNINIPQIAIFNNQKLYDILYKEEQNIKSLKDTQHIHLNKIYNLFLSKSKMKGIHKQQQCIACFQNDQFLLLSDTDLYINCHKLKGDPFFHKLIFIRNRLDLVESRTIVKFDGDKDLHYRGQAVQNFLGHKTDQQFRQYHTTQEYLKYLCQKIALFLNIEQNIRIKTAQFIFAKASDDEYYLIGIQNFFHQNLTLAIKRWQQKVRHRQDTIINKLILNQQDYDRIKEKANEQQVKVMEDQMNQKFNKYAQRFKIKTQNPILTQPEKNQMAFNKLFPKYSQQMDKIIDSMTIKQIRKKILNKPLRRSIVKQSAPTTANSTQYYSFRTSKSLN